MTATNVVGSCVADNCQIAAGGPCKLGHDDPIDCDQFEPSEPLSDDGGADEAGLNQTDEPHPTPRGHKQMQMSEPTIRLHSGQALTASEATRLRQQQRTNVVLPIGAVDVGKTTLIAGIYEMFARATSDLVFAGSLSLIGFESRCFMATAASGRQTEETDRTSRDIDQALLHLRVQNAGATSELLIADVSGENADELVRFGDLGAYGPLLRSATHVLLMVDGERLSLSSERHSCLSEARTLIRALAESRAVREGTSVTCVVTKGDQIDADPDTTVALDDLRNVAVQYFPGTPQLRVSARGTQSRESTERSGLPDLLDILLSPVQHNVARDWSATAATRASHMFAAGGQLLDQLTTGVVS